MLEIGQRFVIMGAWDDSPVPEGKIPIRLSIAYPDNIFGLGWHSTTRSFAERLEQVVKPGLSVLDFGTGTGILAIIAAKLGASEVVAVENAPVAFDYAQRAFELNGVIVRLLEKAPEGQFDIVVANLGDDELDVNRFLLRASLKKGAIALWHT